LFPSSPFAQINAPRIREVLRRLEHGLWSSRPAEGRLEATEPTAEHVDFAAAQKLPRQPIAAPPSSGAPVTWGPMFAQRWWRLELDQPTTAGAFLRWHDRAEATVYLDGTPYFGIDPGHLACPLPEGTRELWIESACCRTGIWVNGESQGISPAGSVFQGWELAARDHDAWSATHDLEVLAELAVHWAGRSMPEGQKVLQSWQFRPPLTEVPGRLRWLLDQLDRAADAYDHGGAPALREALGPVYEALRGGDDAVRLTLTGHAHIDLVWLWPERVGDFKAVHSFANALRMMDDYPEFVFGYSQPASYEAVESRSPALMKQVRGRIAEQRWEATGAMYVESDTQLACGEALVRAFELGQAGFEDLRGESSKVVWLPDVFGYSASLPQIMAGFDVPYFFTTKLHWNSATRFPYSSFRWVGNDGTEVIAHVEHEGYNQEVRADALVGVAEKHQQAAAHGEALFPAGYGDGGGGVNADMCERARRYADLSGIPRCEWGTIEGFFDRLADAKDQLPAWRGEMYLEFHRGVQTTHGPLKSTFRGLERALQIWEAVRCASGGDAIDAHPWKRLVFAQFHDYIPGSSIREVYDEGLPELDALVDSSRQRSLEELEADDGPPSLFNPLAMPRPVYADGRWVSLAPLSGGSADSLETIETAEVRVDAEARSIESPRVQLRLDERGEIEQLVIDGEPLAIRSSLAQAWTFPDHPANFPAWDIDRYCLSNGTHHAEADGIDAAASRGGAEGLTARRGLGESGDLAVTYSVDPVHPVVWLDIDLNLTQTERLVKLAFATDYQGQHGRYGAPFGSVLRPQHPNGVAEDTQFECPGSRWAAVADDTETQGLAVLSESKYGWGIREGLLHVSLARSAKITPSNEGAGEDAMRARGDAEHWDLGRHHIRLALTRYAADAPAADQPAALAESLFTPHLGYRGPARQAGLRGIHGLPSVVPAWAKPAKDGWVLRLHETLGRRGRVSLDLAEGYTATQVDLQGRPAQSPPLDAEPILDISPYQLVSVVIKPAS